jgi:F0F1-type ATP synthase alpha subunit
MLCASLPPPAQVVVVYAATKGYLDKVAVSDITAAETAVLKHVNPAVYKVGIEVRDLVQCICSCSEEVLQGG